MPLQQKFWLMKTEPESFSIDDLAASPRQTTCWDGVRNYQARNFMREMKLGEQILFYHSNAEPPAVVGIATVVREAYSDRTAWDSNDHHYDPKASPGNPIWDMVDIQFAEKFAAPLGLDQLRDVPALAEMELLRKGSRLSVQPVTKAQFESVIRLAHLSTGEAKEKSKARSKSAPTRAKSRPAKKRASPRRHSS